MTFSPSACLLTSPHHKAPWAHPTSWCSGLCFSHSSSSPFFTSSPTSLAYRTSSPALFSSCCTHLAKPQSQMRQKNITYMYFLSAWEELHTRAHWSHSALGPSSSMGPQSCLVVLYVSLLGLTSSVSRWSFQTSPLLTLRCPLLLLPFSRWLSIPLHGENRSYQMDMPLSFCYHLCKPPVSIPILIFLREKPAFLQAKVPLLTCAWCHLPPTRLAFSETSHSGSFFFFFLRYPFCLLYSTPPSQSALFFKINLFFLLR